MEETMTNAELAELRGEIFGLKILLLNCMSFIAGCTDNPDSHLNAIQEQAIAGIAHATHDAVRPQTLRSFQGAAAGLVLQAVEAAKATPQQVPPRLRMQ
jgi:hypothetical protein